MKWMIACGVLGWCLVTANHVNGDDPAQLLASTYRITDGNFTSSGFVVQIDSPESEQPRHVFVSAGHAFESMPGETCILVMRTKSESGEYRRRELTVRLRSSEGKLWTKHEAMDVGAVPIELPPEVDCHPLAYTRIAANDWLDDSGVDVGQACMLPCFPAGIESNRAGWPIHRIGHLASYPLTPVARHKTFIVDIPSFGGESGAPVLVRPSDAADSTVVGIVIGMHRQTFTLKTPIEERVVHRPLGLSVCVHSQYIRETIDALLEGE